jgi:hypothetical protein
MLVINHYQLVLKYIEMIEMSWILFGSLFISWFLQVVWDCEELRQFLKG